MKTPIHSRWLHEVCVFYALLTLSSAAAQTISPGHILSDHSNVSNKIQDEGIQSKQIPCSGTPNIIWKKSLGGSGDDWAKDIETTIDGGYIVAGYSDSKDGDVGANYGEDDYWIVKLDANGNLIWQKNYGGSSEDQAMAVDPTFDKGYIIAGTSSSGDHDVKGGHGLSDVWVVKLDSNGMLQWSKTYGGSSYDGAYDIKQCSDSGYIVAGYTESNNDDLINNPSHGDEDYWLLKIRSDGSIEWQVVEGGIFKDYAHSVKQTSDSGYIVAGYCRSCQDSPDDEDLYIMKVDQNGNFQWDAQYGAWNGDGSSAIIQTSDGGYISAGITHSYQATGTNICNHEIGDYYETCAAMDSADGSYKGTLHEVWLVKTVSTGGPDNSFDNNGMRCYGGTGDDDALDIIQTCSGNYLFAGDSQSSDYDATCNNGQHDFWMGLVNPSGVLIWQESMGGSLDEAASSIVASNDGNYVVAGNSESTDGDVGFTHGGKDYWVVKFYINVPCAPPTNPVTSNIQQSSAVLSWAPAACAVGYRVEYRVHNNGKYFPIILPSSVTSYTLTRLTSSTKYDWKVEALCSTGPNTYSSPTKTKIFTTSVRVGNLDISQPGKLLIYPNPSEKRFTISLHLGNSGYTVATIEIINKLGKIIYSEQADVVDMMLQKEISVPAIQPGVYNVLIEAGGNLFQSEIEIE